MCFPGQRPGKAVVRLSTLGSQAVPVQGQHCGKTSPPAALQMSIPQCQGDDGQLSWSSKPEEDMGCTDTVVQRSWRGALVSRQSAGSCTSSCFLTSDSSLRCPSSRLSAHF